MKVSIIINVYKNVDALRLILESLQLQTYKKFEVVICEDGEDSDMKSLINSNTKLNIVHTTQKDLGIRKAESLNNGIRASTGEYLIFIDGDCIPYSTFIESHLLLAQKNCVLSGRRVNLTKELTEDLKTNKIKAYDIEKNLWKFLYLGLNRDVRLEQGVYFHPDSFINKYILSKRKRHVSIIGCHFSCFKKDIVAINGFDESYGESGVSDDVDLDWRFRASGLKFKSCKNIANMFHMYHSVHNRGDGSDMYNLMNKRKAKNKFT